MRQEVQTWQCAVGCSPWRRNACRWSRPAGWPMWWARCPERLAAVGGRCGCCCRPTAACAARQRMSARCLVRRADLSGRPGPRACTAQRRRRSTCCCWMRPISSTARAGPIPGPDGDWPDNADTLCGPVLGRRRALPAKGVPMAGRPTSCMPMTGRRASPRPICLSRRGRGVRSVMTIHNIAFQGWAPAADAAGAAAARPTHFHADALEYYGGISSAEGRVWSRRTAITTVSPTYAAELMRPEFGMGLQGVIAARAASRVGHPERGRHRRLVARDRSRGSDPIAARR